MRKLILSFLLAVLLGTIFAVGSVWNNFLRTPIIASTQPSVDYVLKPGASIKTLSYDLYHQGVLDHPNFLILLGYLKNVARKLQAGEYNIAPGTTPSQLLEQIASGRAVFHRFTLIEGWTFKQVLAALNRDTHIAHMLNTTNPGEIMSKIGAPPRNPEGLFMPNTYHYTPGTTDITLLKMSYQKMSAALAKAWENRAANLPYKTPYDALIAASLIEKETSKASERPVIAGVLLRRLDNNMPLQIDSTLIYGLGEQYSGKLDRTGLKQDTLYNTYLHRGLPPTPIAMPSLQAIQAALHPDNTSDALYFVSKGNGTHEFSETLQAQSQAVTEYQIKLIYPIIGKRMNVHACQSLWYVSDTLQKVLPCTILLVNKTTSNNLRKLAINHGKKYFTRPLHHT